MLPDRPDKDGLKWPGVISVESQGSFYTIIARGSEDEVSEKLAPHEPTFVEFIPLTLEEIFISEMEDRGYDYSNVII